MEGEDCGSAQQHAADCGSRDGVVVVVLWRCVGLLGFLWGSNEFVDLWFISHFQRLGLFLFMIL